MSFYASPGLRQTLTGPFPACLNGAPMLVPGGTSSVRPQFEAWLTRHQLQPRVVGEFNDGALMKAFGREGGGVFISPSVCEEETAGQYAVNIIGRSDEITENFYAISAERRITHPAVRAITHAAKGELFT
jgi:LysR family transcriptional activator of nhaA